MSSALNIVRMQIADRWSVVALPWLVLASAFVINLLIFGLVRAAGGTRADDGSHNVTGGIMSIFVYALVMGIVMIAQGYRYSQSLGATRRAFYSGTLFTGVAVSAVFALGLTALAGIERLTGGWGIPMHFFDLPWLNSAGIAGLGLVWFNLSLFLFMIGVTYAVNYSRWGLTGSWITAIANALVCVAVIAYFVFVAGSGRAFLEYASTTPAPVLSLWLLIPTALFAATGWAFIRRAPVK